MLCPLYFHLMLVLNVKASEACCRALAVSNMHVMTKSLG